MLIARLHLRAPHARAGSIVPGEEQARRSQFVHPRVEGRQCSGRSRPVGPRHFSRPAEPPAAGTSELDSSHRSSWGSGCSSRSAGAVAQAVVFPGQADVSTPASTRSCKASASQPPEWCCVYSGCSTSGAVALALPCESPKGLTGTGSYTLVAARFNPQGRRQANFGGVTSHRAHRHTLTTCLGENNVTNLGETYLRNLTWRLGFYKGYPFEGTIVINYS